LTEKNLYNSSVFVQPPVALGGVFKGKFTSSIDEKSDGLRKNSMSSPREYQHLTAHSSLGLLTPFKAEGGDNRAVDRL
jgi:hypothetical protein